MTKKITIKEIAELSGVSRGTVDRILHGRGSVSPEKLSAVEEVLQKVGYKFNLHTSAVSLTREYRLSVCMPAYGPGEYWFAVASGIEKATEEYSDIRIALRNVAFDQFDLKSFRTACTALMEQEPDGVIIGPIFERETLELCRLLEMKSIPYAFVDGGVEEADPIASFTTDQTAGGYLLARLLHDRMRHTGEIALFDAEYLGNAITGNLSSRRQGVMEYLSENHMKTTIYGKFSMQEPERNAVYLERFLDDNPQVGGIAVLNSRGHIISDALEELGVSNLAVAGFDLTYNNIRCIKKGTLDFVISQRPMLQGFHAVKSMLSYLLYRGKGQEKSRYMPLDIIFKENLLFYQEVI